MNDPFPKALEVEPVEESQEAKLEDWGIVQLEGWLSAIRRDPVVHGPRLLAKIESLGPELPQDYSELSVAEKLRYFQRHARTAFPADTLRTIAIESKNPVADEAVLSRESLDALEQNKNPKSRLALLKALEKGERIQEGRFILFTDGQEVIFVTIDGAEYRVHEMKHSKLNEEQIRQNFDKVGELIPATRVLAVGADPVGLEFVLLSEKVYGRPLNKEEIISASRELAERSGFVPDINQGNFIRESGEDGTAKYVDGDVLDHLLSTTDLALSEAERWKLEMALSSYSSTENRIEIGKAN